MPNGKNVKLSSINFLGIEETDKYNELLEKIVDTCFEEEKLLDKNLYISITLTNPEEIQKINKEFRNIDKPTDVLSFPMFERNEIHRGSDSLPVSEPLGDVIINLEQVETQSKEYGHSFERELSYMLVHGFYHLMGYDHIEEDDKKEMRAKEEKILNKLEIYR